MASMWSPSRQWIVAINRSITHGDNDAAISSASVANIKNVNTKMIQSSALDT